MFEFMTSNKYKTSFVIILASLILNACGGESSSSEPQVSEQTTTEATNTVEESTEVETTAEQVTYEPEESRLNETAGNSNDLYVAPEFQFQTHQTMTLALTVVDYEGVPLENTMLRVSSIPADVEELDDPKIMEKSLLAIYKTDSSGQVLKAIETSQTVEKLLIEISAIGATNKTIIAVPETGYIEQTL